VYEFIYLLIYADENYNYNVTALKLLGRVAAAYSYKTFPRTICRSVCPVHCEKNGGSDPDAVWRRRSDGSKDEAHSGVWGLVNGKGYFWGRIWGAPL